MIAILDLASGVFTYTKIYPEEHPIVNLPFSLRQENYNNGSCVWATTISLLRWQGEERLADYVRSKQSGGVFTSELYDTIDKAGIRLSVAENGDVSFLEWSCRTRRGAAVTIMGGRHMVALVDITDTQACILDNNNVEEYLWLDREKFIKHWREAGGYAFTPIYIPTAPLP